MTTRQFNESVNEELRRFRDAELREARIEKQYQEFGYHPGVQQGEQSCEASAKQEPTSFSAWLERNNDSIEMPLDRTEATAQWFDNKAKDENPF